MSVVFLLDKDASEVNRLRGYLLGQGQDTLSTTTKTRKQ